MPVSKQRVKKPTKARKSDPKAQCPEDSVAAAKSREMALHQKRENQARRGY